MDLVTLRLEVLSKADDDAQYRRSVFHVINPRSQTEVKRGSAVRRAVRVGGGSAIGATAGGVAAIPVALALKNKGLAAQLSATSVGRYAGSATGAVIGSKANLKSGDTRAVNRSSGRKATGSAYIPGVGRVWRYADDAKDAN